jgi:tRNA A-37 threonylcarbamoyl transferase component Bud32
MVNNNSVPVLVHEHKAPITFPINLDKKRAPNNPIEDWRQYARNQSEKFDQSGGLVAVYDDESYENLDVVRGGVAQLFEYMLSLDLQFGVLSTTDRTWFCKRDDNGTLWISKCFMCAGVNDESVVRAMFAMLIVANENPRMGISSEYEETLLVDLGGRGISARKDDNVHYQVSGKLREIVLNTARRRSQRGTGNVDEDIGTKRSLIEVLPMSADQFSMPLWTHDSYHTVWNSSQSHVARMTMAEDVNTTMVVKTLSEKDHDRHKEDGKLRFQHEIDLYQGPLRMLQGTAVPFMLYGGRFYPGRFIIALSDEGDSLMHIEGVSDAEKKAMHESFRQALASVHNAGVLHGDIHPRNLVWNRVTGQGRIVDFGLAEYVKDMDSETNRMRFKGEMAQLDSIFS